MGLANTPYVIQSESKTFNIMDITRRNTIKFIKYPRLVGRRYSNAIILNSKLNNVIVSNDPHTYLRIFLTVFNSIIE